MCLLNCARSLPLEIARIVAAGLDMASLLALRETGHAWYSMVTELLAEDKEALLRHYVHDPGLLWEILADNHAVVGGLAALSFFLRDRKALPDHLDVYVGANQADLLQHMLEDEEDVHLLRISSIKLHAGDNDRNRGVKRSTTYAARDQRRIVVHHSTSESALFAISRTWTSVLMNFVCSDTFGCAYPSLTLYRKAIWPGDDFIRAEEVLERTLLTGSHRLQFGTRPSQLLDVSQYNPRITGEENTATYHCMRVHSLCPAQGRYFGDVGSILAVFDPLRTTTEQLRERHSPPYGLTAVWRLRRGPECCDGYCDNQDGLLPAMTSAATVLLVRTKAMFHFQYVGRTV